MAFLKANGQKCLDWSVGNSVPADMAVKSSNPALLCNPALQRILLMNECFHV